jgi:glycosyltransferase involved in cell wall biosynthesis
LNSLSTDFSALFARELKLLPPAAAGGQLKKIALIGPSEHRACGLATFTCDIVNNAREHGSKFQFNHIAILREGEISDADISLIETDRSSYCTAARSINEGLYDGVWLQHEFGIFGGKDGNWAIDLAERAAAPLLITFHTILAKPSPSQRHIIKRLVALASRMMVMSEQGRNLLVEQYGAVRERISLIEHGAPDRPLNLGKGSQDLTMATFGLIGPGKGLETALEALAKVKPYHPTITYRIIGATHPVLLAKEGEAYRESLKQQIQRLGLEENVEWVNRFLDIDDLLAELDRCQIYLTPYTNLQQSTSGTLSYAVALGKAVVSTPYVHARELLADGYGRLFPVGDADALASIVQNLADNPDELVALQQRAYARGRVTIWPEFVKNVDDMVSKILVAPQDSIHRDRLSAVPGLAGFFAMIDGTGMLQHSCGLIPDRHHGYCLDDNVRALMLMNEAGDARNAHHYRNILTLCSFIQYAYNPETGNFRNFMGYDRSWLEHEGSEDSNGRAIWAFGHSYRYSPIADVREWGRQWFDRSTTMALGMRSPRAMAFAAIGAAHVLDADPHHAKAGELLQHVGETLFQLLKASTCPDWVWFETVLGYDNPRLPEALMRAGQVVGNATWVETAVDALRWINEKQCSERMLFRPIGSDGFGQQHDFLPFDQQPLEAWSTIDACATASEIAPMPEWGLHARSAMSWFYGRNDRGIALADIANGTCRDGITRQGVNENRGAESILAFQLGYYGYMRLAGFNGWDVANDERNEHGVRNAIGHSRFETDRRSAAGSASPISSQLAG